MIRSLLVLALVLALAPVARAQVPQVTHGDPLGPFTRDAGTAGHRLEAPAANALATTGCATERTTDDTADASTNGPVVKLVYARPSDQPDDYATRKDLLEGAAARITQILSDASGGTLDLRWDTGTACGPTTVDITSVTLPHPLAYYQAMDYGTAFSAIGSDIKAQLGWQEKVTPLRFDDVPLRDLAAFVEGISVSNIAGVGSLFADETKSFTNVSNEGLGQAEVYPSADWAGADPFAEVLLHEISHTLGAVQDGAPNSTGAGHCVDEVDVMCYADGGPRNTIVNRCGASAVFFSQYDCGKDDYFNVNPSPGTYLAEHWNLADSVFLCAPSRCLSPHDPPAVAVGVTSGPAESGDTVDFTADTTASDSPVLHYLWDFADGTTEETDTDTESHSFSVQGPYPVRVRAFNADGLYTDSTVIVPVYAHPSVQITGAASGRTGDALTFQATSNDTHGGVVSWSWTFGDGTTQVAGASVDHAYASAGLYGVSVEVAYADGVTATTGTSVSVTKPAPVVTVTPPVTVRTPTPTPTARPAITPTPTDTSSTSTSTLSIRSAPASLKRRRLRNHGLHVSISVSAPTTVSATLICGGARVAHTSNALPASGGWALVLGVTSRGERVLARRRGRSCTLTVTGLGLAAHVPVQIRR